VAGGLVGDLEHPLAQVRFDDVDALAFEVLVDLDLLAGHRLALDEAVGVPVVTHLGDVLVGVGGVLGDVHRPAVGLDGFGECVDQFREALDGVFLDSAGLFAQALVVVEFGDRLVAPGVEPAGVLGDGGALRLQELADVGGLGLVGVGTHSTTTTSTAFGP